MAHDETRPDALDPAAPDPAGIDPAIADYYQRSPEEHRLDSPAFPLEAARTRELVTRFAPRAPATVLDIGGAAGAYALWLATAGYTVHLVDASPRLVAEAQRRSDAATHPLASCRTGDARAVDHPDHSADIVLLLGPLYHLTEADDRQRALAEAKRLLKPGGHLFAAAISRFASTLDGLAHDLFADPAFAAIAERGLREGQHRNTTGRLEFFTTAYFHRPEELRDEASQAGFDVEDVFGIEGPAWLLADAGERLQDARRREDLLRVARQLEREPSLLGMSAHLLLVARTPAATT